MPCQQSGSPPHALLLEEEVASVRAGDLVRLCLTPRQTEVLRAAEAMHDEADGVRTAADAVARALRESA